MSLRDELSAAGAVSQADVQQAFDQARQYEFMGRRLEPWTVRRHSVALQLRSRLMRAMDDENHSVSAFLTDGFYPHVFHDMTVVLYLMHLGKREVIELEQLSYPDAMELAYSWAEGIPLEYGSELFFQAAKILGKLLHSMHVSWFQTVQKEGTDNEQKKIHSVDTGPLGNSKFAPEQSDPVDTTPTM